jgi:transposase-like protein
VYLPPVQVFFRSEDEVEVFLCRLPFMNCPSCKTVGVVIRHGFIRWSHSPEEDGVRAWRIRCKKSPLRNGCGKTFSIRLGQTIPRHCFSAKQLWAFMQALCAARSIKAAWERAAIPLSLDTGYRVYRRLCHCQSILRTHLCARAPPPKGSTGVPLLQVFAHLKEAFIRGCAVSNYQEHFQRSFLAMA